MDIAAATYNTGIVFVVLPALSCVFDRDPLGGLSDDNNSCQDQ